MNQDQQRVILLASVRSMISELTDRIGDTNPYLSVDLESYDISDLSLIKRTLHELLYAPPPRGR
jgi:hypothetical protein